MARTAVLAATLSVVALAALSGAPAATAATDTDGGMAEPSLHNRIIGGQRTSLGDFPSVVALLANHSRSTKFQRQGCAGTLVAPRWVLTAAHCVIDSGVTVPAATWTVLSGETVLDNSDRTDRFGEVDVLNVFPHPQYGIPGPQQNDIALLELVEPIDQPLMALYDLPAATLDGVQSVVTGWGVIDNRDPDNPLFDTHQRAVSVPVVTRALCNASASYNGAITDSQLCAGLAEGGQDACQGDSGGPMIIGIDGFQVQAGVVSYGIGCALPGFYGVYASVSSYRGWIENLVTVRFLPANPILADQPQESLLPSQPNQNPVDSEQPVAIAQPSLSGRTGGGGGALLWWILPAALACKLRRRAFGAQSGASS